MYRAKFYYGTFSKHTTEWLGTRWEWETGPPPDDCKCRQQMEFWRDIDGDGLLEMVWLCDCPTGHNMYIQTETGSCPDNLGGGSVDSGSSSDSGLPVHSGNLGDKPGHFDVLIIDGSTIDGMPMPGRENKEGNEDIQPMDDYSKYPPASGFDTDYFGLFSMWWANYSTYFDLGWDILWSIGFSFFWDVITSKGIFAVGYVVLTVLAAATAFLMIPIKRPDFYITGISPTPVGMSKILNIVATAGFKYDNKNDTLNTGGEFWELGWDEQVDIICDYMYEKGWGG